MSFPTCVSVGKKQTKKKQTLSRALGLFAITEINFKNKIACIAPDEKPFFNQK